MSFIERHFVWILAATITVLAALAYANRFMMDDAFISFRYAENFALGRGLVFNPGEAVEGYTNFLWTLLMAIPFVVGVGVETFSQAVGIACFAGTLVFTYRVASRLLASRIHGLLVVAFVGTNYSLSAYATGGLETMLQALLIIAAFDLALRTDSHHGRNDVFFSVVAALALLTRLDSVVLLFPAAVLRAAPLWRSNLKRRIVAKRLARLVLPGTSLLGAWLAWKLATYVALLPNTFSAKVSDEILVGRGFYYIGSFLFSYHLAPFLLTVPFAFLHAIREHIRPMLAILIALTLWVAYIIWVGGDFMEFRFVVPALPLAFIALVWIVVRIIRHRVIRPALFALIPIGSLHHALTFGADSKPTARVDRIIESVGMLKSHLDQENWNWRGIGRVLGDALAAHPDVTIATTAAGAIPFFAKVRAIDMHGLTDRHVALRGKPTPGNVGHRRVATLSYLIERKVHLVLGHPWLVPNRRTRAAETTPWVPSDAKNFVHFEPGDTLPPGALIVEIPVSAAWSVAALYLTRHAAVDAAIAKRGWVAFGNR